MEMRSSFVCRRRVCGRLARQPVSMSRQQRQTAARASLDFSGWQRLRLQSFETNHDDASAESEARAPRDWRGSDRDAADRAADFPRKAAVRERRGREAETRFSQNIGGHQNAKLRDRDGAQMRPGMDDARSASRKCRRRGPAASSRIFRCRPMEAEKIRAGQAHPAIPSGRTLSARRRRVRC